MARKRKSKNQWEDHYTRRARKENFPARSVYKLEEIQKKFDIIKKTHRVLDLGCAPGAWLLYACKVAGPGGRVTGVDKKGLKITLPANAQFFQEDIFEIEPEIERIVGSGHNVVLSDMAPATTGRKEVDAARSHNLCMSALNVAKTVLADGGVLVCKIFQGEDFNSFIESVDATFRNHKIFKPKSSRKASKEIFVIGTGKKRVTHQ